MGGERRYLDRYRPTDGVDLHHLEREMEKRELWGEGMRQQDHISENHQCSLRTHTHITSALNNFRCTVSSIQCTRIIRLIIDFTFIRSNLFKHV